MNVSVVIPCYNSSHTIGSVVDRLIATLSKRYAKTDYEIILVNDSSPDDTYDVISSLANDNRSIKAINLSRNFGQHAAIMAGFSQVEGDVIVCMDDDGQTVPEEIFKLIDTLDESCDLVYASYSLKKHSAFRNLGSKLNDLMTCWLLGKPKDLYLSSYFAAKRYLIEEAKNYTNPYPYLQGQMLRATNKIKNANVQHNARLEGSSGYTLSKLVSLWLNGFTAFSVKPLRMASFLGIAFALLGFISALVVVIRRLFDPSMALGWSSTFTLILVLGGLILFVLGLIGEYIGRSYISINKAPQFIIRDSVNCKQSTSKQETK